jgi:threonine/homoserine/homoserine lactone efflux protein
MSLETLLLFIPACFALNLAPGPNNLLSVSNGTRYGFWNASLAGIGRLVAFVGMIAIAASGLSLVLQASEIAFNVVKFLGALYLFYIAFQLWRAPVSEQTLNSSVSVGILALARQEFLVAAGNPKAIVIFTAFLPQFVDPTKATEIQFAILGALFLLLEFIAIGAYAYLGSHLATWFAVPKRKQLFNRTCASFLGFAGLGLLLSRRSS